MMPFKVTLQGVGSPPVTFLKWRGWGRHLQKALIQSTNTC